MLFTLRLNGLTTLFLLSLPITVGAGAEDESAKGGFDFTKLGADGSELVIQDRQWRDRGNEHEGTRWRCVRDNATGLTWEVKTRDNWREVYNFAQAEGYARNTSFCGSSNWRVPNPEELLSIIDHSAEEGPRIDKRYFHHARSAFYWSNQVHAPYPAYAVGVHFGNGVVTTADQSGRNRVRLVHGGR